jgi:hypothetical protein
LNLLKGEEMGTCEDVMRQETIIQEIEKVKKANFDILKDQIMNGDQSE